MIVKQSCSRSACPITNSLDILGDRWTLVIIRDLMFRDMSEYGQLLEAGEGISTNILADRLKRLLREGIVTKKINPQDKKRIEYTLTEKGIALMPILLETTLWGVNHLPGVYVPPEFMKMLTNNKMKLIEETEKKLRRKLK